MKPDELEALAVVMRRNRVFKVELQLGGVPVSIELHQSAFEAAKPEPETPPLPTPTAAMPTGDELRYWSSSPPADEEVKPE